MESRMYLALCSGGGAVDPVRGRTRTLKLLFFHCSNFLFISVSLAGNIKSPSVASNGVDFLQKTS